MTNLAIVDLTSSVLLSTTRNQLANDKPVDMRSVHKLLCWWLTKIMEL